MLRTFSVKNFKGFKDWVVFDLSNVKSYEFNPECIRDGIINKALIYGYNGTGKSNLGVAIMDIIFNLTDKNKKYELYDNYLNADSYDTIAMFSYLFQFNGVTLKYDYGKTGQDILVYEHVTINNNKIIISYDKKASQKLEINLPGTETLNKDLSQIKISVLKYIKANAVLKDSPEGSILTAFFSFVDNMLLFWHLTDKGYQGYEIGTASMFNDIIENNHFEDFTKFLEIAGVDSNIAYEKENDKYILYFVFGKKKIDFWSSCSTGMRSLVLFYFWLQRLKLKETAPSFVFIDEFDAFYHQALAKFLIEELKKINLCQIFLTTHDTSIMTNDLMRPDCLFLMYKNKINSVADSTEKELRFAHNIEKMYKAGAFDA